MTRVLRVLFLGDNGVGKSSMVIRFINNAFYDEHPYFENSYRKYINIGESYLIDIFDSVDFAFDETVKASAFLENEGFMIAFSLTDRNTFLNLSKYMDEIRHYKEGKSVPILLVGTKCDLEALRVVTANEISEISTQWGVPYLETSALASVSVEEAFQNISRLIVDAYPDPAPQPPRRKKCTLL